KFFYATLNHLIYAQASLRASKRARALRHAAVWGLTRPIDYLIEAGVSVDTVISQRSGLVRNALCVAASRGHEHIVRHLVSRGARMTISDIGADSPMHVAVRKRN